MNPQALSICGFLSLVLPDLSMSTWGLARSPHPP